MKHNTNKVNIFNKIFNKIDDYNSLIKNINNALKIVNHTNKNITICIIELVQNALAYKIDADSYVNLNIYDNNNQIIIEIENESCKLNANKLVKHFNSVKVLSKVELKSKLLKNIANNESNENVGNGIITFILKSHKVNLLINNTKTNNNKQIIFQVFFNKN